MNSKGSLIEPVTLAQAYDPLLSSKAPARVLSGRKQKYRIFSSQLIKDFF